MFEVKKRKQLNMVIQALVIILIFTGVIFASSKLSDRVNQDRREIIQDSINRYVVQCYALEGGYPHSLDYLEDNYTLVLDHSKYVYHYKFIGYNMMPEIAVFEKNE